jgi:hypothetical protein
MRQKIELTTLAAIFIFAVAPSSANAATPDDACSLLTQPQVSAALGLSVDAGSHPIPEHSKRCVWSPANAAIGSKDASEGLDASTGVMLTIVSVDEYYRTEQTIRQANEEKWEGAKVGATPISGLGDDAYYATVGPVTNLFVKKGKVAFCVEVRGGFSDDRLEAIEKTFASQVLSKA